MVKFRMAISLDCPRKLWATRMKAKKGRRMIRIFFMRNQIYYHNKVSSCSQNAYSVSIFKSFELRAAGRCQSGKREHQPNDFFQRAKLPFVPSLALQPAGKACFSFPFASPCGFPASQTVLKPSGIWRCFQVFPQAALVTTACFIERCLSLVIGMKSRKKLSNKMNYRNNHETSSLCPFTCAVFSRFQKKTLIFKKKCNEMT